MDIDFEDLKKKYRKKTRVDLADLVQLQTMVPILIREICRLEGELNEVSEYVRQLEKKKPPLEIHGKMAKAQWSAVYDMKKKRMTIRLKGIFDAKSAKKASNAIIAILGNVSKDFDLINDIRELDTISDMKAAFHLKKTRYHMVQAGINRSVRIVPEKETVGATLFATYFKESANTMVVQSMEDAETALDNQGKFLNT